MFADSRIDRDVLWREIRKRINMERQLFVDAQLADADAAQQLPKPSPGIIFQDKIGNCNAMTTEEKIKLKRRRNLRGKFKKSKPKSKKAFEFKVRKMKIKETAPQQYQYNFPTVVLKLCGCCPSKSHASPSQYRQDSDQHKSRSQEVQTADCSLSPKNVQSYPSNSKILGDDSNGFINLQTEHLKSLQLLLPRLSSVCQSLDGLFLTLKSVVVSKALTSPTEVVDELNMKSGVEDPTSHPEENNCTQISGLRHEPQSPSAVHIVPHTFQNSENLCTQFSSPISNGHFSGESPKDLNSEIENSLYEDETLEICSKHESIKRVFEGKIKKIGNQCSEEHHQQLEQNTRKGAETDFPDLNINTDELLLLLKQQELIHQTRNGEPISASEQRILFRKPSEGTNRALPPQLQHCRVLTKSNVKTGHTILDAMETCEKQSVNKNEEVISFTAIEQDCSDYLSNKKTALTQKLEYVTPEGKVENQGRSFPGNLPAHQKDHDCCSQDLFENSQEGNEAGDSTMQKAEYTGENFGTQAAEADLKNGEESSCPVDRYLKRKVDKLVEKTLNEQQEKKYKQKEVENLQMKEKTDKPHMPPPESVHFNSKTKHQLNSELTGMNITEVARAHDLAVHILLNPWRGITVKQTTRFKYPENKNLEIRKAVTKALWDLRSNAPVEEVHKRILNIQWENIHIKAFNIMVKMFIFSLSRSAPFIIESLSSNDPNDSESSSSDSAEYAKKPDPVCLLASRPILRGELIEGLAGFILKANQDELHNLKKWNFPKFTKGRHWGVYGPLAFLKEGKVNNSEAIFLSVDGIGVKATQNIHKGEKLSISFKSLEKHLSKV